jgi:hypothetical protein
MHLNAAYDGATQASFVVFLILFLIPWSRLRSLQVNRAFLDSHHRVEFLRTTTDLALSFVRNRLWKMSQQHSPDCVVCEKKGQRPQK